MTTLIRRTMLLGALGSLGGCSTLASLNAASEALDTYELRAAAGTSSGSRRSRTLLIAPPQTSAALATDRITVKTGLASVTYLPDARWSDEVPALVQSLLVRSIARTGRIGYVGRSDNGPVPDVVMLVRVDAFEVVQGAEGAFSVEISVDLTLINDSSQRVIATRQSSRSQPIADDEIITIVAGFQAALDAVLPDLADWALARV